MKILLSAVLALASLGAVPTFASYEPQLVRDVHEGSGGVWGRALVEAGGLLYYAIDDGVHGEELWVTDGSEEGTHLVKDIRAGAWASNIAGATAVGDFLYFVANDGTHGRELWRSDGTPAGTHLVLDIFAGEVSSDPESLVDLGGLALFSANDGSSGVELWKSDGTAIGTTMVLDLFPSFASSFPSGLIRFRDEVFFAASDGVHGSELWKTDGSAAGTSMVRDIEPGAESSSPGGFAVVGSYVLFRAMSEAMGVELWRTTGTEAGTVPVKDLTPGTGGAWPRKLTTIGDQVFFLLPYLPYPGPVGLELWKTDGTEENTVLVWDFPGAYIQDVLDLDATDELLFLLLASGHNENDLWRSDGSVAGTFPLVTIPGVVYSLPRLDFDLAAAGGDVYFAHKNELSGRELWKTDGSVGGTTLVADIAPGPPDSSPSGLGILATNVLFFADDLVHGPELWSTTAGGSGVELVRDLVEISAGAFPAVLTPGGGQLFFAATDGHHGFELWKSNGTESGTRLVAEREAGPEPIFHSFPPLYYYSPFWGIAEVDGGIVASVDGGLWGSDGSTSIDPIALPQSDPEVRDLMSVGGVAYFVVKGRELWRSDGTEGGTYKIFQSDCSVSYLTGADSRLFFSGCSLAGEYGLFRSDGSAAGTEKIFEGAGRMPVAFGGEAYFTFIDFGTFPYVSTLWKTVGEGAASVMVAEFPGQVSSMVRAGSTLFLELDDDELWKSDGTAEGTVLVKSGLRPLGSLTAVDELAYFSGRDPVFGEELWRSDGTTAGTFMVADIFTGPEGSAPAELAAFNGKLFFSGEDDLYGRELFVSDGSVAGTNLIVDLRPGEAGSEPRHFTEVSGVLFFSANDGFWGRELWRITTPPVVAVNDLNALEGDSGLQELAVGVSLSHVSNLEIRLSFSTLGQSAVPGEDYVSESGTVVVAPGTLEGSIFLDVFGDEDIEADEDFLVHLSSPINAALETQYARVVILNDDFELGGCGLADAMDLHQLEISDHRSFSACTEISIRDVSVISTGQLDLTAGVGIAIGDGFSVQAGGVLVASIDPALSD